MIEFKPLAGADRQRLLDALKRNVEDGNAIFMDRQTGFSSTAKNLREASDDEVISAIQSVPCHYSGLSTLSGNLSTSFRVGNAANNLTGSVYNPVSNSVTISKSYSLGTSKTNVQSGGADQVFSFQTTVSGGATATLNLTNMTNLLLQSSVAIARIKGIQLRLLSTADDSTIQTTGGSTSSAVAVANNTVTTPAAIFPNGGSGLTLTLTVSTGAVSGVAIGAAGSGYPASTTFLVAPQQTGGSGATVWVTTNGSGVPTTVGVASGGTGYTAATVPTAVTGHVLLNSSSAYMYFDPSANGYATGLSSTNQNISIFNLDPTNVATVEVDVFAGSN